MKKIILATVFMLIALVVEGQTRYSFSNYGSLEKENVTTAITLVKDQLGEPLKQEDGLVLWKKKEENYRYTIAVKRKGYRVIYKGTDISIKEKLKELCKKFEPLE